MLFERGLTLNELVTRVRELVPNLATIYADAAEPRSIEELYRAGLNVHAAQKDVWAGIMAVKGYPLYVHKDSKDLQAELMSYKWKKDKNDNILEEPVKESDHLCDALRYGIFTRLSTPKLTWGIK
jgi:phage terminase large subunit